MKRVAYFCMEYGLHEDLPIYAGGLGVLAGDYVKSAGDLQMPVVAFGLYWREGYTQQTIGPDGRPHDEYPEYKGGALADTGKSVHVTIDDRDVEARIWQVTGHKCAPLYLLDPIAEEDRWITLRLYGGRSEDRVAQEVLLGVGGVRALRALGLEVDVYHFNEGHAVFAGVELISEKMAGGESFGQAWASIRPQVIFTTHTPVEAGNETHPHEVIERLGAYGALTREQMVALGGDPFGMTIAGLRLARLANAVSALHGETARQMWRHVQGAAPIIHVTNGVHAPTWQDERVRAAMRGERKLWEVRRAMKLELFAVVKERAGVALDPDALTIGFARRAAGYKRADLILSKPERIARHFEAGRVQIVFSGKAHPHDEHGKSIVQQLAEVARRWPRSVVFLQNYDIGIARLLVRGADVWLNNPRRPLEASGTSGMKAALNGTLNLSILDGWWSEGCVHGVTGWQIGHAENLPDDERDARFLYDTLENDVLRTWATDRAQWLSMMRATIEMAQEKFTSDRMVRDYYAHMYEPSPQAMRQAG